MTSDEGLANETDLYRPFGEQAETILSVNAVREAKGYIGERYDADAGLLYLNARYYDPRLGLFLQPDWWEVMQAGVGTNRYSYSFNDPVNGRDPTGHFANPSHKDCGNCKKTPKGGYSSEINPERKKTQPGNRFCGKGCAGKVTYEKRPTDFLEYGLHAQSPMGLAAATIDDVGLDANADMKAVAELASVAFGPGGIVAGGRAGLAAIRGLQAGSGVWKLGWAARGNIIETALGKNLPGAFPTIDKLVDSVVTSIKSVDLNAATYQNATRLERTLTGYVDKVIDFTKARFDNITVDRKMYSNKALEIAIPNTPTQAQQQVIDRVIDYGQLNGVNVTTTIFP